jgi:hypothetical protein
MKHALRLLMFTALACALMNADCDPNVTQDPTFRDWCGDGLCDWVTTKGHVQRVPTWDQNDFGVSFLDADGGTDIAQLTVENQAKCLLFSSVGDIDPNANMEVSADFNNDGTIDFTGQLGSAQWEQVQTAISAPPAYSGITFHVTKRGTGTAVLAQMRVQSSTGCTPAPPLTNLAMGDVCTQTSDCAPGLLCATVPNTDYRLCSQCDGSCPGGEACTQRSVFMPFQCAAGLGHGDAGVPCLNGSDCGSGTCAGAQPYPLALDGGTCDLETLGSSDLSNCQWFGARAGACQ